MHGAANAPSSNSDAQTQLPKRQLSFRWSTLMVVLSWAAASAVLLIATIPPRMPRAGLLAGGDDFFVYRDAARHLFVLERASSFIRRTCPLASANGERLAA